MKTPARSPYISYLSQSSFFFRKTLRRQERDGGDSGISENDAGPMPEGSREKLAARSPTCNHSRPVKHTVLCHHKHLTSQRETRVHALRLPLLILLALTSPALPQSNQPQDSAALVRRAIQNREDAARTHRPLRYLLRKTGDHRDTTKDIIETDQGYVARLIRAGFKIAIEKLPARLD